MQLTELETVIFENYEITLEDASPAVTGAGATGGQSSRAGEGRVTILIRYIEPIQAFGGFGGGPAGGPAAAPTAQAGAPGEEAAEEAASGTTLTPIPRLNALIIEYDNPAELKEIEDLIDQLDQATKQVEVETKFVQVNESRAKEFKAGFSLENFANGQTFNTDVWRLNSRFAQAQDEFRDLFAPPIEGPFDGPKLHPGDRRSRHFL